MRQRQVDRHRRAAQARARARYDELPDLDPRDPDVIRVKRLFARQAYVADPRVDHRVPSHRPVAPSTGRWAARDARAS